MGTQEVGIAGWCDSNDVAIAGPDAVSCYEIIEHGEQAQAAVDDLGCKGWSGFDDGALGHG